MTVYIRYADGTIDGPFDEAETAEDWLLDNGAAAPEHEIVDALEVEADEGEVLLDVRVRVTGARDAAEARELLERALDAWNGEGFAPGELALVRQADF